MKLEFKVGDIIQVYKYKGFSKIVDILVPNSFGQYHPVNSIEHEIGTGSNTIIKYVTKLHESGSDYKLSGKVYECIASQCHVIDGGLALKILDYDLQAWKMKKLNLMKLLDIPPNVWDEYLK